LSAADAPRGRFAALRGVLPKGQALPENVWQARHTGIIALLWAHALVIPVFALRQGFSLSHSLIEAGVVPLAAAIAMQPTLGRRVRTAVASVGLLTCSAVLVHLSGGLIEMHFHFFVMVAIVALYQDWVPFLAAVGYVFVHHGLMGVIAPDSVYNHIAGRNDPWTWAGIHAFFIMGISAACLVTWRLNESIFDERRRAEERLREESRIVEALHEVGKTLAADLDTKRVVQAVTDAATQLTHAAFGAFFYNVVDHDGEAYMLFTLSGAPVEAFERFGLPRNTPIFAPTFAGEGVVRLDDVMADPRYGTMAPHHGMPKGHLPVRSYLAVPVPSRTGEVLGGLFFGHPEVGQFSDVDERIVVGIASQAAMALDNARLYESEREARTASDSARERVSVLAEAGRILMSSLEVEKLLRGLSRLLSSRIADSCVIHLLEDDGGLRRLIVASVGDGQWTTGAATTVAGDEDHEAIRSAITTRQAVLVTGDDAAFVRHLHPDPAFAAAVDADPPGTVVVAPLLSRDRVLGSLTLATSRTSGHSLRADDVPYLEELARRTAMAVENAHLYSRQRTVAETLQHSLLPERLPEIPGLSSAARYLPGGPDVEIGGDWYDVIPLSSGRLALAMGDVVGRGERAASLMGQLRSSVRAYALDGKAPVDVMDSINSLLLEGSSEQMATMVYGVLDVETGTFAYVNAGHPPPLLADPSGEAAFLDGLPGLPVGASASAHYEECRAVLRPGGTVVFFTDGLVEDRATPLDLGLSRLRQAVLSAPDDIDALCGYVVAQSMSGRSHLDDAAILAVRLEPLGNRLHLRLPSEPHLLSPLRAVLRRWLRGVGATEVESYELLVATIELCTNAIRHASGSGDAHFEVFAEADELVQIRVVDEGRWRQSRTSVGGRGLAIAEAYADEVEVLRGSGGTEVRLSRRLEAAPLTEMLR
jgi:GAF domain-containing protein/anti-sigma regulatory factor (Ser/Thr protein kinase)